MVDEIELQGTVRTKSGWLAMARAADNRSYLIRKGQALFDGEVIEITAVDVTFRQNVNDPTNPKPFREVTKSLGSRGNGDEGMPDDAHRQVVPGLAFRGRKHAA